MTSSLSPILTPALNPTVVRALLHSRLHDFICWVSMGEGKIMMPVVYCLLNLAGRHLESKRHCGHTTILPICMACFTFASLRDRVGRGIGL